MSSLRTLVVVGVLVGVGYMVYATLHRQPPPGPPEGVPDDWGGAPIVEMPGELGGAPSFVQANPEFSPSTPSYPGVGVTPEAPPFPDATANVASSAWTQDPSVAPEGSDHRGHNHTGATAPSSYNAAAPSNYAAPLPGETPVYGEAPPLNNTGSAPQYDAMETTAPSGAPQAYDPPPGVEPQIPTPQDFTSAQPAGEDRYGTAATEMQAGTAATQMHGDASTIDPAPAESYDDRYTQPAYPATAGAGDAVAESTVADSAFSGQFAAALVQIQSMLDQKQLAEAHRALSQWYGVTELSESDRAQMVDLLDRLAGTVVYSQMHLMERAYEVQPGDTLESIGAMYNVPWQMLAKVNGITDPSLLRSGQLVKVVQGPFNATIELESHVLTLWLGDLYAGRFRIGLGRDYSTPEGEFEVLAKVENPTYYGPDGVVDRDDPNNPLGERWIDLGNQIGIHGTIDPTSIGRDVSRGCVRLSPRGIEDVYDILSVGSKVVIRR